MENIVTKQNAGFPWREAGKKLLQILLVCYAAILVMTLLQVVLYAVPGEEDTAATGAAVITQGFAGLLDIVTAMVSAIGTIILLWGFFEWGLSWQGQDGYTQSSSFKRISGGIVMILAPQLINIFLTQV
jgi:hypothetical protein